MISVYDSIHLNKRKVFKRITLQLTKPVQTSNTEQPNEHNG